MKYFFKQPLLHFLLIGLGLFLIYNFTGEKGSEEVDLRTVVVDKQALLTFMQYRSKAFNREEFEGRLENTSDEELMRLIDDYVREEVLHREALALNLDKDDYVIRRRLVQKLEFINQGFTEGSLNLSEKDIQQFFEMNKQDYYVEPHVTFTHVFLDNERYGSEEAERLAKEKLKELNRNKVSFTESTKHGDRFLYHTNYVERTPEYIASHFGPEMAKSVFELEASDSVWRGPFKSPYGYHLVMMTSNEEGRYPEIGEIYERVKQDTKYAVTKKRTEKTIKDIIDSYDVKIVYKKDHEDGSNRKAYLRPESEADKTNQ